VKFLASRGPLKEEKINDKRLYRITTQGGELLEALRTVRKFIQPWKPGLP